MLRGIRWRAGFFRLWVVLTLAWVGGYLLWADPFGDFRRLQNVRASLDYVEAMLALPNGAVLLPDRESVDRSANEAHRASLRA